MWAVADAVAGLCDHAGVPTGTPLGPSLRGRRLESAVREGENPVPATQMGGRDLAREYGGARGRPSEAGETTLQG